jgi:hypothetical protein
MNEKVATGPVGQTQLLFRDGSTLTIGSSSQLTIDTFVYDPDQRTAKMAMTVSAGIIRFVGGRASKSEDGVAIRTPVAALAIRGGIADVAHDPVTGTTTGQFLFGRQMSFTTGSDSRTLTKPGFGISVGPNGHLSQPFMITSQGLAQTNRAIEGKAGGTAAAASNGNGNGGTTAAAANAAGAGNASAALDDSAKAVSAANSSAPPPPPPVVQVVQAVAQQAQTNAQTVITTLTNQQSAGVLNNASGAVASLGTTAAPTLTSGNYNGAAILPQNGNGVLEPGNALTYANYTYTQQGVTTADTASLHLTFSDNQIRVANTTEVLTQSGASPTQGGNYTDNSNGQTTFSGTNLSNIVVDNNVFLGVITGGTITAQDSDTFTGGPQNTSNSRSYTLLPTDTLPATFGKPIDPSLMPSSGLYTYNLTASTAVYASNGQAMGQLNSSVLTVYFGGSPNAAQDNVAAAWTGQLTVGGGTFQIATTATGTAASLSQALSSGSGKNVSLTGSTARGDLSGLFNFTPISGTTFCAQGCIGAAAGFFAGAAGTQIGLVYQAPGSSQQTGLQSSGPNLVGAASFTRK